LGGGGGVHKCGALGRRAIELCVVAYDICGASVWNWLFCTLWRLRF